MLHHLKYCFPLQYIFAFFEAIYLTIFCSSKGLGSFVQFQTKISAIFKNCNFSSCRMFWQNNWNSQWSRSSSRICSVLAQRARSNRVWQPIFSIYFSVRNRVKQSTLGQDSESAQKRGESGSLHRQAKDTNPPPWVFVRQLVPVCTSSWSNCLIRHVNSTRSIAHPDRDTFSRCLLQVSTDTPV